MGLLMDLVGLGLVLLAALLVNYMGAAMLAPTADVVEDDVSSEFGGAERINSTYIMVTQYVPITGVAAYLVFIAYRQYRRQRLSTARTARVRR